MTSPVISASVAAVEVVGYNGAAEFDGEMITVKRPRLLSAMACGGPKTASR